MPFDGSNYDAPVKNPVTELLEQAWRLIDKPQKWCRGQPEAADGRRLCSLAAVQTTAWRDGLSPENHVRALSTLSLAMGGNIMGFNDCSSHREVAAAWQRAIAASRNHG